MSAAIPGGTIPRNRCAHPGAWLNNSLMTTGTTERWNQHTRQTLLRYDEALLRQLAHKLCKPRNQWPVDELLDRVVAALNNAAMVDRRLKEVPAACRQILCVIAHSRQTRWPLGSLVEMLVALGA